MIENKKEHGMKALGIFLSEYVAFGGELQFSDLHFINICYLKNS